MTIDAGQQIEQATTPPPVVETPAPAEQPAVETPAPAKAAKPVALRDSLEASLAAIRDRPRDDAGRFAAAQKAAKAAASAKPVLAAVPPVAAAPTPAPVVAAKPERPADMPKAWGADKAAHWASLTPDARAYITERETQMEGFHAKFGGLKDYADAAASNGTTLPEVLERVNTVETAMLQDPSQGLLLASQMVGMDRNATARALMGALQRLGVNVGQPQQQQPNGQQPAQQPIMDPRVDHLARQLETIQGTFQQQALAKAQGEVDAFFADTKNKYAQQLQTEIVAELKSMKALGQPANLPKAYERALWTRPDLRETLIAEQFAEKQKAVEATRTQELERSRSASRSVAGAPPTAEGRSSADKPVALRDEVSMHVRNMMGRA